MTKREKREQEEARDALREQLPPGSTVYTVLRHVSRSGMSRWLDLYWIGEDKSPHWITRLTARATGIRFDERREALKVEGCGMDMGFHAVYVLSRALFPEGFGCTGEGCPSNDHPNGDRDYTPHGGCRLCLEDTHKPRPEHVTSHWHSDGGYALQHRWL